MRKSIIISFMFAFITNANASAYLAQSDVANVKLPSSFVDNGVKYTTTALQGISSQHIDINYVQRIIREHLKEISQSNFLKVDHVYMLFRKTTGSDSPIELSSVWRND